MKNILVAILGIITAVAGSWFYFNNNESPAVGASLSQFVSQQLASNPIAGYVLSTDGFVNSWIPASGGGSSKWTDSGSVIYPTGGESVAVSSISATGTATSTFTNLAVSIGLNLFGTIGTALSDFCVAITGGAGLCDGNDATGGSGGGLATSTPWTNGNLAYVTGLGTVGSVATGTLTESVSGLQFDNTRGVVGGSAVLSLTSGFDIPLSASTSDWNSFRNTPSSRITAGNYLSWSSNTLNASVQISTSSSNGNLAFWTGSSALGNVATGTLTETVSGLELSATRALVGGSSILSLTSGFAIPSTTDFTGWNLASSSRHSAVTLSGALDYITLVGQDIVRGAIDLATDITGFLGITNGGTGTSTAPTTDQILVGRAGGAYDYRRITAGSNVTVSTSTAGQIQISATGGSGGGLSTTSPWTNGNLAFVTGLGTVGSVATGTLTTTATGTQFSATRGVVGGSAIFSWSTGYDAVLNASSSNWNSFWNTPSSRITAGTGIDWSGNTLNGVYTAGDALTLTGEDFDFDGGATPAGELGGTWASPTIDDSLAVTSWNLTTPTLTSFFGTPCTGNFFLQDISDTGAFTCVEATGGGGGGGGALSTTTDVIGAPATPELVSYVTGDVMFGGSASTSAEFQFDDDGGQFIISSTSNANATATIESTNSAQAVRIGDDSGVGMENIFSTVATMITRFYGAILTWIIDIQKVAITGKLFVATTTYNGATTTDAVVINGYTNSGEWIQEFCTTPTGETTQVVADTLRGCVRYAYLEDAAGAIDFVVPTTGTSTYFNIQPGATGANNAAGDGMGIGWASGLDFGDIQRHQPAMEFAIRQDTVNNATSTTVQAGLTSAIGVSADFATEAAQGFYVISTSTTPNYLLACNPASGATTYVDTGIASSSTTVANANPFTHFRLEVGGTANTAVTVILKARTTTNRNMVDVASCTQNNSASTQAVAPTISIGKSGAGTSSDLHVMFIKFWYKQPVFY